MREIKFRAYYQRVPDGYSIVEGEYTMEDLTSRGIIFSQERIHWVQYTGLKDNNGKEIYEGDIVRAWEYCDEDDPELNEFELSEVKYYAKECDYPAFEIKSKYFYESNALQAGVVEGRIEVIGNIYENKELLENK